MQDNTQLTVETSAFGPDAFRALKNSLGEARSGLSDPLTVVVPNNHVGISVRRALAARCGGIAGVSFLTLYRLADLLGSRRLAGRGRRSVSNAVLASTVRSVLRIEPGLFAGISEHPTTERRLVGAHRELSDLSPAELAVLASRGAPASDVVRVHRGVAAAISGQWYTEQDLIAAACEELAADAASGMALGRCVVFLPTQIRDPGARLLLRLSQVVPVHVIVGISGQTPADDGAAALVAGLTPAAPSSATRTPPILAVRAPGADTVPDRGTGRTPADSDRCPVTVTLVSDPDDEVRHVVRGVLEAARDGVAFAKMAVAYGASDPYARLLADHLANAGIATNGASTAGLRQNTLGRLLSQLLALHDDGYRRDDLINIIASAPILWRHKSVPTRRWDLVSRAAGVVRGPEDWDRRLGAYIADLEGELAQVGEDPDRSGPARSLRTEIDHAVALAEFAASLFGRIRHAAAGPGWGTRSRRFAALLGDLTGTTVGWPPHEASAADAVIACLDRLAALDAIEPDVTQAIYRRTVDLELDSGLGRHGTFGRGILIGPTSLTAGLDLERVWVVGMREGLFPRPPEDDSLLPDRQRRAVGALERRSARSAGEHRDLLATVAAVMPDGVAHLSLPRGDLRHSTDFVPSRWLLDIIEGQLGFRPADAAIADIDESWVRSIPSFAGGLLTAPFPATVQEHDLIALASLPLGERAQSRIVAGTRLEDGHRMEVARRSRSFTRFDGNLAGVPLPDPSVVGANTAALSATALEAWASCPHQYFMRLLLGVDPLEIPELRLRLDPLTRGTLIHTILERFVTPRLKDAHEGRGWGAEDAGRLAHIADEEFAHVEARGLTGLDVYWRRDKVLLTRDLEAFLAADSLRRIDQGLRPIGTELAFGVGGASPVPVRIAPDREIRLRGSIDLVDTNADGDLVITDYKTGKHVALKPEDPHRGGTKLQLVLYAIAARHVLATPAAAVHSAYWHLNRASDYRRVGYDVTPSVQESVLSAVRTIVDNIASGIFPKRPPESDRPDWVACAYCDPDGIGTSDARRALEHMASDPALSGFLALTEPRLALHPKLTVESPRG